MASNKATSERTVDATNTSSVSSSYSKLQSGLKTISSKSKKNITEKKEKDTMTIKEGKYTKEKNASAVDSHDAPDRSMSDFYCIVCDSHMNSSQMWDSHVQGKRHQRNVISKSLTEKSVKKSSNLSPIEKELNEIDDPIIGLKYVSEIRKLDSKVEPSYKCFLCSTNLANGKILIEHLYGLKHKLAYIKENDPAGYKLIDGFGLRKGALVNIVDEHANKLEAQHGRGTMTVEFDKTTPKKRRIVRKIGNSAKKRKAESICSDDSSSWSNHHKSKSFRDSSPNQRVYDRDFRSSTDTTRLFPNNVDRDLSNLSSTNPMTQNTMPFKDDLYRFSQDITFDINSSVARLERETMLMLEQQRFIQNVQQIDRRTVQDEASVQRRSDSLMLPNPEHNNRSMLIDYRHEGSSLQRRPESMQLPIQDHNHTSMLTDYRQAFSSGTNTQNRAEMPTIWHPVQTSIETPPSNWSSTDNNLSFKTSETMSPSLLDFIKIIHMAPLSVRLDLLEKLIPAEPTSNKECDRLQDVSNSIMGSVMKYKILHLQPEQQKKLREICGLATDTFSSLNSTKSVTELEDNRYRRDYQHTRSNSPERSKTVREIMSHRGDLFVRAESLSSHNMRQTNIRHPIDSNRNDYFFS